MKQRELRVLGAAEHNLRDVDVAFGPGLTAIVAVPGSGKSSLAFGDTYTILVTRPGSARHAQEP